jgi:pimeloyl-ACP methyl ester carboxylesterase
MIARAMQERLEISGAAARTLEVEVAGPESGRAVLLHTGTPSAGRLFAAHVEAGADRGLRHITYSRPGYGRSSRQAGRTVADCVQDVVAVADHLGAERFFTIGVSGGGPHALACAALLGERVLAAATIGSVAPHEAQGLDWQAGMGRENLEEFAAAKAGPEPLVEFQERACHELAHAEGSQVQAILGDLLSEVDRAALTGEFAEYLAAGTRAALECGVWGWFDDDVAHISGWGFDPAAIERPLTIWQGGQDRFVPPAHGAWLASHIPGARPQLLGEQGHLSLWLSAYGEVLDGLIAGGS